VGSNLSAPSILYSQTNITAGISNSLEAIRAAELSKENLGVHHILILLTDGIHNVGIPPNSTTISKMSRALRKVCPALKLSVVVIGISDSSSTAMGMLLKSKLETVNLQTISPIYFAQTAQDMMNVLTEMKSGIEKTRGCVVQVEPLFAPDEPTSADTMEGDEKEGILGDVSSSPVKHAPVYCTEETEASFICVGQTRLIALKITLVGGSTVYRSVEASDEAGAFDENIVASALAILTERARIARVVSLEAPTKKEHASLQRIKVLIDFFERHLMEKYKGQGGEKALFNLARATPEGRIAQHKALKSNLQGLKELKNNLASILAFNSTSSSAQAAFLNGSQSKLAAKALARNAKLRGQGELHELITTELECIACQMRNALRNDLCKRVVLATRAGGFAGSDDGNKLSSRIAPDPDARARLIVQFIKWGERNSADSEEIAARREVVNILEGKCSLEATQGLSVKAGKILDGGELDLCLDDFLSNELELASNGQGSCNRSSYLSLLTAREHLREWVNAGPMAADVCRGGEWEVLMFIGALAMPCDVERRAATQMDPYAMVVHRCRTSLVDTASLCYALKLEQPVVPPEGGLAVVDALVLVDPCSPQASRIAANSVLLGQAWTSVTLCRDLNMYTGNTMRVALHAHAMASLCVGRPAHKHRHGVSGSSSRSASGELAQKDFEAQLRRNFLGRAHQCAQCNFGPITHMACSDLSAHHGEGVGQHAKVDNSCPRCHWFAEELNAWPMWDGTVPKTAWAGAEEMGGLLSSTHPADASPFECGTPTRAHLDAALRVAYSARQVMGLRYARTLVAKLCAWDESVTPVDGVDHPIQLALALVCISDGIGPVDDRNINGDSKDGSECTAVEDALDMTSAFSAPALLTLLNEACARAARDYLRASGNRNSTSSSAANNSMPTTSAASTEASVTPIVACATSPENADSCSGFDIMSAGEIVVAGFLGVTPKSAPVCQDVATAEPPERLVRDACDATYTLQRTRSRRIERNATGASSKEGGCGDAGHSTFDFCAFVESACAPRLGVVAFAVALRAALKRRGGGWLRLAQDMEVGHSGAYADVIDYLADPMLSPLALGPSALLDALLCLDANNSNPASKLNESGPFERSMQFRSAVAKAQIASNNSTDAIAKAVATAEKANQFPSRISARAAMAAQALLHCASAQHRRSEPRNVDSKSGTMDDDTEVGNYAPGGLLKSPLPDVRNSGEVLREVAVRLRMAVYRKRVRQKMAKWQQVGSEVVVARARAADLGQFIELCGGSCHAHGLDKPTFWGLWRAATEDCHEGAKVAHFLGLANDEFRRKHWDD